MNRDSKILLKNNLVNFIKFFFEVDINLFTKFLIEVDESEKIDWSKQPSGLMLTFLSVTNNKNNKLEIELIIELLTTDRNEIPIWIKVIEVEKAKIYKLIICKRFRKKKVVEEWHRNSDFYPFII
ncbi:hypothetical protein [Chryseobacterium caseinilyticum]|uniref:DUF4365 domain-containing protein n=1 Tax=Chryseobacterium caseinilyticum TaxID=2771428 RepID=A0ABR8ZES9_9FLAO|nr:hypothetical protein [Chryseobacterium caseinilyticum]MBD8083579.1 hypothetical protein [Chryseobacterium caseinilyticum]